MSIFRKWVLAIGLFVAIVVDGVCSFYLHQFMDYGSFGAASLILPISVMLIGLFDDTNENEIWLALGTGIVADIYLWPYWSLCSFLTPQLLDLSKNCSLFTRNILGKTNCSFIRNDNFCSI